MVTVYHKCSMELFDAEGQRELPCEVRVGDGSIAVSYEDGGTIVVYQGTETEPGHFKLTGRGDGVSGRATLHCFANDDVLEGWYVENNYEGMWRLILDE